MRQLRSTVVSWFFLIMFSLAFLSSPVFSHFGWADSKEAPSPSLPAEAQKVDEAAKVRVKQAFGRMPLYFIENRGQVDSRAAYYIRGRDKKLYFTSEGVIFVLTGPAEEAAATSVRRVALTQAARQRWALKLEFVGADPNVKPSGEEATPAVISYFKGPKEEWKTGLKTYGKIVYRDLWPGIDLALSGTASRLKYLFVVKPGADPERIRLAYHGATAVKVSDAGELQVSTPVGGFSDEKPFSYQGGDGEREEVATAYLLDSSGDKPVYGFRLATYDRSKVLFIDPAVLVYAGYIGGNGDDEGFGIAVDAFGNAYVAGRTTSTEATFPDGDGFGLLPGPDQIHNGGLDAFVAKVKTDGSGLDYVSYIGGSENDQGFGIAVDGLGSAYVVGTTFSTEATFPVTVGPDTTFNGGGDVFVAKVQADGSGLDYAGYIGGSAFDQGLGIAVDWVGNAYVTGFANSAEATFPDGDGFGPLPGPDQTFNGGGVDVFVAKVKADGSGLDYAGYIGGSGLDFGFGIAVDGLGNAYVTGQTSSTETTFPDGDGFGLVPGPDQTHNGGGTDAFVAKVKADGTGLDYAGYIGGAAPDEGFGIAVDALGNVYVTGLTISDEATFPDGDGFGLLPGPDQTFNGVFDAFVVKVKEDGSGLDYAGYIGGAGLDVGEGIAVNGSGNAYVTGFTNSTEATFPDGDGFGGLAGPDQTHNGGGSDAFVVKVRASGKGLEYAGYIGGSGDDLGLAIAVDGLGNAYVTGQTSSTEASFPDGDGFGLLPGPDQTHNGGLTDAFVAKVSDNNQPNANLTAQPTRGKEPLAVSFQFSGSDPDNDPISCELNFGDGTTQALASCNGTISHTYVLPGGYQAILTVTDADGATDTAQLGISVAKNRPPSPRFATRLVSGQLRTVQFTDRSTDDGVIVGFLWTFGDGTTSTERNPVHTYSAAGTFQITLTVTDDNGAKATGRGRVTVQ